MRLQTPDLIQSEGPMEKGVTSQRRYPRLYRSRWGIFAPTGLVLVTLIGLLLIAPLFQRQINAGWVVVADLIEPSRILLGDIQTALAREMATVRAYALTGDPLFVERYWDLLAQERQLFTELQQLVLALNPEVVAAYGAFSTTARAWHRRPSEEEMLAGALEATGYVERIAGEQVMWDRLLTTSNGLRDALLAEENRARTEILRLERARRATTAVLVLLALLAALAAAWMARQIQHLRVQAESRGRELNRLMESRAHLIRGITHDIKNPLGVIAGYAELLEGGILAGGASREAVGRIREASTSAVHLVDDLLELSLSEAGELRLQFEPTRIQDQVEMTVREHAVAARQADLVLTAEVPEHLPEVMTDRRRIRQILGNLLSNAIKYTPGGGRVRVSVSSAPGGGETDSIAIEVADTGTGIAQDKLEEIFLEFTRLEAGAERGTGLGLTISRRIARSLGGDITVRSECGKGSVFTLWIPLHPPPEHVSKASALAERVWEE
jgi:signal transduction histidine kinase